MARQKEQSVRPSGSVAEGARAEAAWAQMQNTLEEIELSAAGGASAFSAEHTRALEELRNAQISLAQAWARSEADDDGVGETLGQHAEKRSQGNGRQVKVAENEQDATATTAQGRRSTRKDSTDDSQMPSLEEETTNDINLARKRRETNDRYFEKVNRGVIDVVEKLDVVADKMRGVEMEAQDLWNSRSSLASDSPG
ncbi:MAG: hypothetical protein Q9162_001880 [Coniocarpon cinnabarinum]